MLALRATAPVTPVADPYASLNAVPIVGPALHTALIQIKPAVEAEFKKRLTPYFIGAFALGGLGLVVGTIALIKSGRR